MVIKHFIALDLWRICEEHNFTIYLVSYTLFPTGRWEI